MAFDEEAPSFPATERSHVMSSTTETKKRSKKTRCLGPVQVLRPDQYEAFDVDSKMECIRALIPLGLMHVQEVLEEEVCTWAGARYVAENSWICPDGGMGVTRAVCSWRGNGIPCGFPVCSTRPAGRSPYRLSTGFEAQDRWMTSSSSGCCMASPVGTLRPPPRPSLARLGCRVQRCREPLRRPVPNS